MKKNQKPTAALVPAKQTAAQSDPFTVTDLSTGQKLVTVRRSPKEMTGVADKNWAGRLIGQAVNAIATDLSTRGADKAALEGIEALAALAPENGLEAMVAVQMVACHNLALELARRSLVPDQPSDTSESRLASAGKLMKLFLEQVQTLQNLRGKASMQRVTVEHVTVQAGGQAVVGAVGVGGHAENQK